jgi:LysM repeat protein
LSTIARKYGVTVAELKTWNYIGRKGIRPGKKLIVYVSEQKSTTPKLEVKSDQNLAAKKDTTEKLVAENTTAQTEYIQHKVKKGENLSGIAHIYGVDFKDIKELNNLQNNNLKYGQILKIKPKGE